MVSNYFLNCSFISPDKKIDGIKVQGKVTILSHVFLSIVFGRCNLYITELIVRSGDESHHHDTNL